jgi:undecaprenyl diphosphate synthase
VVIESIAQAADILKEMGIAPEHLPRHIAIIMDGNGRWAKQRGWPRIFGHQQGVKVVNTVTTACARLGIKYLTLYSFSVENWRRPKDEVDALMQLCVDYLVLERPTMMEHNVRLVHVGRREGLSQRVLDTFDETIQYTSGNTGLALCLALNYGSRTEIMDGVRRIARQVQAGTLKPEDIDEATISGSLYTAGIPDPDLIIRTAGQMRISNFLLWQISYAEWHVTDVFWPDFSDDHLLAAIKDYAQRERRFGGIGGQPPASK